jgi:hypothetical protein
VLILEEAAYCDEGFFYETVAPILSIGSASLVAISTLTSEINFYTRLIQMVDPATERPLFAVRCIELCCERCKEEGKQAECVHMLHLVPMWQSEERHRKLKIMMQDRPDLIQSELAGLAFDSLQQVFRKPDIAIAMSLPPMPLHSNPIVFVVIDPAAGGPQSDYAVVSIVRSRGCITVSVSGECVSGECVSGECVSGECVISQSVIYKILDQPYATVHASVHLVTNIVDVLLASVINSGIMCLRRFIKKLHNLLFPASDSLLIMLFFS